MSGRRRDAAGPRTAAVLVGALLVAGAPAPPAASRVVPEPCSAGLVALTFDDGPATGVTGRLLRTLADRGVPATFFVLGERASAAPRLVRREYRSGLVVGNHTYLHQQLTRLSDAAIRRTVRDTDAAIRAAGAVPAPLVRPPYGDVDSRVRAVLDGMDLATVLWDVDPRDWESGTPAEIADRVLGALTPHGRNIVLLHDGVARSENTLLAVPRIVRGARADGYCFGALDAHGQPVVPVPRVRVDDAEVVEADPGAVSVLRFHLRLDRPGLRRVSVRVRTVPGSAAPGADYRGLDERVTFEPGTTQRWVRVTVRGDRVDEVRERLRLRLLEPRGVRLEDGTGVGTIVDDDPRPRVRLHDVAVTEPAGGTVVAPVVIALDRPSSRSVQVGVVTVAGSADATDYVPLDVVVDVPPGVTRASVPVRVRADDDVEEVETFEVHVVSVVRARVEDGTASVTIEPPEQAPEAGQPTG